MSFSEQKISVVMPSYNERDNIIEAMDRIINALGPSLYEIIVVDDDSPDKTWELVEHYRDPRCTVMRRVDQRGLASALAQGTQKASGEVVVWLDCDLGIHPENIPKLVEKLEGCDIAFGSRYVRGGSDERPFWRGALSVLFNLFAQILLGFRVKDYTSGFAAVRKEVLQTIPLPSTGFGDYFIEWIYKCSKHPFKIAEVGYRYHLRKGGLSKTDSNPFTFLRLGLQYALKVIEVRFKK
jgi:dolichol-phosphate mannosyltransferase